MSGPGQACPSCDGPAERLSGMEQSACVNPRCRMSLMIDDTAIARLIIEMRPGVGIVTHWWRDSRTSAFSALRFFNAMLQSATSHVPVAIAEGMKKLAGFN